MAFVKNEHGFCVERENGEDGVSAKMRDKTTHTAPSQRARLSFRRQTSSFFQQSKEGRGLVIHGLFFYNVFCAERRGAPLLADGNGL